MGKRPGSPKFEDDVWIALLERYVAGETQAALAREYDVSVSAIAWQARSKGYRKKDRPNAVYRWVQPPPITLMPSAEVACGWAFDPDDLEGSEARALELAKAAAREGRPLDFVRMTQTVRATRRLRIGGASPSPPHPVGDADHPPHEGEGEAVELRASQRPPQGDWATWLFLGGRGAGKTLAGAMWLSDQAEALGSSGRLALIGPTLHDVREVMIEGVSGIAGLARWNHPKWGGRRPVFEPSRRRLTFPNGAVAYAFSAEDRDSLRGPQFAAAWADEFCAWRGGRETLALLRMGLRLAGARQRYSCPCGGGQAAQQPGGEGWANDPETAAALPCPPHPVAARPPSPGGEGEAVAPPRLMISTTPRPTAALRALRGEPGLVETRAATRDNAAHLAGGFLDGLEALYGGTRKAAQELEGQVVEAEGALFTADMIGAAKAGGEAGAEPFDRVPFDRVVVAVDPSTTAGGNACGIVVVGRRGERAWVLADLSLAGLGPDGWARRAVRAARDHGAQALVVEVNQGGEMVKSVLRTAGCDVRIREVRATRGKRVRAEPVAALYEQGRVAHAPGLGLLEEELMAFGGEDERLYDLDRADALVWAVTDLLIDRTGTAQGPSIRVLDLPFHRSGISLR